MADWSAIASHSTAGGTLLLALATSSSVRASQRSPRIALAGVSRHWRLDGHDFRE